MTEQEKQKLLEAEEDMYIRCESFMRSVVPRLPALQSWEVESHMKACREYLEKYLDEYKDIYHPLSPFALKFGDKNAPIPECKLKAYQNNKKTNEGTA